MASATVAAAATAVARVSRYTPQAPAIAATEVAFEKDGRIARPEAVQQSRKKL